MAGRKSFDDDAFRALLKDSVQDLEVSEKLRARTLEACRQALDSSVPAAESEGPARRTGTVLPFVGRHAVFIRTAAGLAACLLLAVLLMQFYPRMGSYRSASDAMNDSAVAAQENQAAGGGASAEMSMAAAAPEQPEAAMAKSALAEPDAAASSDEVSNGDLATVVGDISRIAPESGASATGGTAAGGSAAETTALLPSVTFAGPMDNGSPAASPAPPEASAVNGIRGGEGTMALTTTARFWTSYGAGLWTSPLPARPNDAEADVAAKGYERTHPGETVEPAHRFAGLLLSQPLTGDGLAKARSLSELLAKDTAGTDTPLGLWMMPVRQADSRGLVPLVVNADGIGTTDPVRLTNADAWLDVLSDEAVLRKTLETACGTPVTAWTIVDVDGGAGFWVQWQANGTEWIMPFMDRAADLGLENGRPYAWDALVATVAPFL